MLIRIILLGITKETKALIENDPVVVKIQGRNTLVRIRRALRRNNTWRSIFYWRIEHDENYYRKLWLRKIILILSYFVYKPISCSFLACSSSIGENFQIAHTQTYFTISAQRIGKNVMILQGVTIGKNHNEKPVIGDNVTIFANAVVVGGITIGDNAVIGANCFVDFDVPPNSIVRINCENTILIKENKKKM